MLSSVVAICFEDRFYTRKKVGHAVHMAAALASWLAVEQLWSALAGPPLILLAQTGVGTTPLPGTISGTVSIFRSGIVFARQRALTTESSLLSGCTQGKQPQEIDLEELWQVSSASSKQNRKYGSRKVFIA